MFKKLNIKVLGVIFITLLCVVIVAIVMDKKGGNKSADLRKANINQVDTAKITEIIISRFEEEDISIKIESNGWKVSSGDIIFPASQNVVKGMLQDLANIKVERIASKSKEKWGNYRVSDSTGTHVQVKEGDDITADIVVGRFSYQQMPQNQMMGQYGGGQNMKFSTFVRKYDEETVYMIDGMMSMNFNVKLNDLRNKQITSIQKTAIRNISFKYHADSSFTLTKKDNSWMINRKKADSAAVAKYLNTISSLRGNYFVDGFTPSGNASFSVSVSGDNFTPVSIQAFPADTVNKFAIQSSDNPSSFYSGFKGNLFDRIFVKTSDFEIVE